MYKQVIVLRSDLGLSPGKAAAQAAHASLEAYLRANISLQKKWRSSGAKKVILKADLKEIIEIKKKAERLKIPCALIKDAGLTEIPKGTITCIGLGPDLEGKIDRLTVSLPLF